MQVFCGSNALLQSINKDINGKIYLVNELKYSSKRDSKATKFCGDLVQLLEIFEMKMGFFGSCFAFVVVVTVLEAASLL